jgi:hypothetical protein
VIGMAIEYESDEKRQDLVGSQNRDNGVVRLRYQPNPNPTPTNHGHYCALDEENNVLETDNNALCLPNSIVAGMSERDRKRLGIHSGKDLVDKLEAHRLANPDYSSRSDMYYQKLFYHAPNALCLGAGH